MEYQQNLQLLVILTCCFQSGVICAAINSTAASNNVSATGFVINTIPPLPISPPVLLPDIVLTLVVIAGCVLAGVGIAKIADAIYDRIIQAREKEQAASEHARKMLRTRAVVMNMRPPAKDPEVATTRVIAAKWMKRTAEGRYPVMGLTPNSNTSKTPIVNIKVTEMSPKTSESTDKNKDNQINQHKGSANNDPRDISAAQLGFTTQGNRVSPHPIAMMDVEVKKGGPLPPLSPKIHI